MGQSGKALGDCWEHSALGPAGDPAGMIPFHKLAQWLTYSLIEPFESFGIKFVDSYLLTGLAEVRRTPGLSASTLERFWTLVTLSHVCVHDVCAGGRACGRLARS